MIMMMVVTKMTITATAIMAYYDDKLNVHSNNTQTQISKW
jgi:hypothetical protein